MNKNEIVILSDLKVRVNTLKQLNIPFLFSVIGEVFDNEVNQKIYKLYKLEYANKVYIEQMHRMNECMNDYLLVYNFPKEDKPKEWHLEVFDNYLDYPVDYYDKMIKLR